MNGPKDEAVDVAMRSDPRSLMVFAILAGYSSRAAVGCTWVAGPYTSRALAEAELDAFLEDLERLRATPTGAAWLAGGSDDREFYRVHALEVLDRPVAARSPASAQATDATANTNRERAFGTRAVDRRRGPSDDGSVE